MRRARKPQAIKRMIKKPPLCRYTCICIKLLFGKAQHPHFLKYGFKFSLKKSFYKIVKTFDSIEKFQIHIFKKYGHSHYKRIICIYIYTHTHEASLIQIHKYEFHLNSLLHHIVLAYFYLINYNAICYSSESGRFNRPHLRLSSIHIYTELIASKLNMFIFLDIHAILKLQRHP